MRERFQRLVPLGEIAAATAFNPIDGGSLASTRIRIFGLRRQLFGTPFMIANEYGVGYGLFFAKDVGIERRLGGRVWVRQTGNVYRSLLVDEPLSGDRPGIPKGW
jgi:hypothetical protein